MKNIGIRNYVFLCGFFCIYKLIYLYHTNLHRIGQERDYFNETYQEEFEKLDIIIKYLFNTWYNSTELKGDN